MKKLLVLLSFIAASAGIYLALDVMYGPDEPPAVPVAQEVASAEVAPEAEQDETEVEPEIAATQPAVIQAAKKPTPKPAEVKLIVREIKFDGVTAFSQDELKGLMSEFIGQELTLEQALAIPSRVTQYYKAHDIGSKWLA